MANYVLEAKDCLPFNVKKGTPNNQAHIDAAMRQLCNYWYTADGNAGDDDYLACMRTAPVADDTEVSPESERSEDPTTGWWAGRYIGLAHLRVPLTEKTLHQFEISIRPRFGEKFLLAILEDIYNIKVTTQEASDSNSPEWFSSLLNLLRRRMWVDKCAKANRYGLPRTNVKREHQGVILRGALDIRRTIMPWMLKKEVCTNTFEKTLDDRICKIVYEAHRILSRNIVSLDRKRKKDDAKKLQGFGFSMPTTVQDTINALNSQYKGTTFDLTENDYQRIRYKSIYQSWKPLVDFSWSVIKGCQLSYKASESQTDCVFVDMAEIWESFLRKKLGEGLKDDGWRVLSVEECHFRIYKDKFFERDIIPDIILEREGKDGKEYMVFDAKYKRMRGIKAKGRYSDVDRSDLFQIHTYIQYVQQNLGKVVLGGLLYPITCDDGDIDSQSFHSSHLFGNAGDTPPFIVDGVVCREEETEEKANLEDNVKNMIGRLKDLVAT